MDLLTLQCLVVQQPHRGITHPDELGTYCAACALERTRLLFRADTMDLTMLEAFKVMVPPIRVNLPPIRILCYWCGEQLEFE